MRLTARRGVHFGINKVRGRNATEAERAALDEQFAIKTAQDVAAVLGGMKGAIMKAGQMLSFIADGLPPEAQAALATLQQDVPPMAPSLAAGVIRSELGDDPEKIFLEWNPTPLGAASIGQVHKAVTRDGRIVAVKVQYPGVDKAIKSDLDNAEMLYGMFASFALRNLDVKSLVDELRERMADELDYRLEASLQTEFAERYDGHPFIRIPKIVPELSTQRVLVSEWVDGLRFDDFIATADEATRQKAAEVMFRFAQGAIQHHHVFNGDPHPGNYILHDDGTVTFLDFGLVKRWGPGELESLSGGARLHPRPRHSGHHCRRHRGWVPARRSRPRPAARLRLRLGSLRPLHGRGVHLHPRLDLEGSPDGRRRAGPVRRRHPTAQHAHVVRHPRSCCVGNVSAAWTAPRDQPLAGLVGRIPQGRAARNRAWPDRAGVAKLSPGGAVVGYLRKYVVAPRYRQGQRLALTAADGTALTAYRLPGPSDAPCTVVLVHGFVNWSRTPAIHSFAELLADDVEVIVPDLRGHGRSGGECTFGHHEPLDVAAAVAAADPGRPVVTVGISLGGAAVLLHAGSSPGAVAGVVAISAPIGWGDLGTAGARLVERWVATRTSRFVLRALLRTRLKAGPSDVPDPAGVVASIAPAFTIVVADPDDWYFGPEHAERLHEWARSPKELWWYAGAGHGTDLLTTAFAARLLTAIEGHLADRAAASGPSSAGPAGP